MGGANNIQVSTLKFLFVINRSVNALSTYKSVLLLTLDLTADSSRGS